MLNSLILTSALAVPAVVYAQSIQRPRAVMLLRTTTTSRLTGQNLNETGLDACERHADDFGKIAFLPGGWKVDGQPLYLPISELPTGRTSGLRRFRT